MSLQTGGSGAPHSSASAERDFIISRVFPVPREVAFRAWTDPARLCHWWGPEGFSNPVCRVDCRTGGQYRIVMRSPDGTDYPLKGEFREIIPPERMTFTMDCSENPEEWHDMFNPGRDRELPRPTLLSLANVWFEELAAKTKLTIQITFETQAIRDTFLKLGMCEGWSQSLDRLEHLLAAR